MSYNYATLQTACLQALVKAQPPSYVPPADFATLFPRAIEYAEARIYRELVLLATRAQNTQLTTAAGSRQIALGTITVPGALVVPEGLALIVPGSASNPALGMRVPYDEASLDTIDLLWPVEATTLAPSIADWMPRFWALRDNATVVYCPTADAAYTVEITGLFQLTALSATNTTTYLSQQYPDLLFLACMVFLSGPLIHNWGAQSGDPAQAQSYEMQYGIAKASAEHEELRRRGLVPNIAIQKAPVAPQGKPA